MTKLGDLANNINLGWSYTGLIMGVMSTLVILFGWRMTRGGELFPEKLHVRFSDIITGPFKNKPFLYVIGFYAMTIMAMALGTSFFVYYLKYFMMYDEESISIALAIIFVPSILWIPIVDYVSKRFSKRISWLVFSTVFVIANLCLYLFVQPGDDITLYIILAFISVMTLIPYQIGWSIIPDCVEIDEYKTGARREGIYYGVVTFIQKGGSALILGIAGMLLEMVGYNSELVSQTPRTLEGIRQILVGGTVLLFTVGMVLVFFFPLTREKHRAILKALEIKKRGGTVDESSFKDCIS